MKWSHLPVAGGLYDQDPDLLDKFEFIFRAISQHEAEEREKEKSEQKKQEAKTRRSSSGGRGRRR